MTTVVVDSLDGNSWLYTKADRIYLESERSLARICKQTYGFPFPVNVLYTDGFRQPNTITEEKVKKFFPNYKSELTVVYTNNITTNHNYMPMTPWIVAHRMMHCFEQKPKQHSDSITNLTDLFAYEYLKEYDAFIEYIQLCFLNRQKRRLIDLPTGYEKDLNSNRYNGSWSIRWISPSFCEGPFWNEFYCELLTMRSARTNKLNENDISAELWAQYCICGTVSFNKLRSLPDDDNDKIHQFVPRLNASFANLQQALKGEIISF